MIVFIDTEVDPITKKVTDFGALKEDGSELHSQSHTEFYSFVSNCETVCGHNLIGHDLKYISLKNNPDVVDTLYLSPLLFPKRPYHHLVKDEKLQVDEFNNPLNDSKKARDLFNDEKAAWDKLSPDRQEIYYHLLHETSEFGGFFRYISYTPSRRQSFLNRIVNVQYDYTNLILKEYQGRICSHADLKLIIEKYPIEFAYCLAVIGADDIFSITPAWVLRNYPQVSYVMHLLRNKSCGNCNYCYRKLDAHYGLKEFFGYDEFRTFDGVPMQQQAVESAIRGESLLTIFPTGGGKSLTFQLPALMEGRNTHGLTVIISPLQSLMKDQVDNLAARGISEAVTINGLLDPIERSVAVKQVKEGTANLLYIAPEMLRSKTIEHLLVNRNVVRFVIDEAHCFSAWGHDFRVDYLYIADFIRELQEKKGLNKPIAVSCFTATAKQKVITDICDYFRTKLGLNLKVFAANSERKNLHYSVRHAETREDKYNQLRSLIIEHDCPSIVYVSRTKRTHELAEHLTKDGINALPFNGKMDADEKVKNQNAFMSGEAQVIVATSAFGMGVDKKDVGLVVHYDISDSLENYVQEAGRAGRDPHMEADCYVLFADSDLDKHFILLNQTKLSISEIQQVWKAIRDLTAKRQKVSCSALDIARQAGWGEETFDLETRVRAAISALEDAGFVHRGTNSPHIFATGISVKNMDEARSRLTKSPLFDEKSREEAIRIISSLISARATYEMKGAEAESRVDYLADILGMDKGTVIRNINLMRQDGLLADSRDMQAWVTKSTSLRSLDVILRLEQYLLQRFTEEAQRFNYKELNEEAQKAGISYCTVRRLRMLLHFMTLKGYIQKQEHGVTDSVAIRLQSSKEAVMNRFERRKDICYFIIETLNANRDSSKDNVLVNFSVVELLKQYIADQQQLLFTTCEKPVIADIEEALLYLTKTELMKIEGGFIVIYNTMQISRIVDNYAKYGKDKYRLLDEFYKQRIRQIHIVGKYANLMVRDYDSALRFVNDYFIMDFRQFINKYFNKEELKQIEQNITPEKYKKIFGNLSKRQLEIINDKQSKYIVVAAGPGSGKTMVLVHKLASLLIMEDVKHEQLLMLTFSRAAATEFKKRLIGLVGSAAHYVDIKTFHSYSFDLIGKLGNLHEADKVVLHAAEMIENGEVETAKIAKTVLVIDEAQDIGADDFRLVQALITHNEEMRVIAVGDDDQNIYAFRGSDSAYIKSLKEKDGAKFYEMIENYRSSKAIVDHANRFVRRIPNRMKNTPILSVTNEEGKVQYIDSLKEAHIEEQGSTAILTPTNELAMQIAYSLEQRGIHATLAQQIGGFRFGDLAEVRYFLKQMNTSDDVRITKGQWEGAKRRTLDKYATSKCIDIMRHFFNDFEETHDSYYRSDLLEFIFESNIEDFITTNGHSIFVSTVHKAKGREFDNVYLFGAVPSGADLEYMRSYYVGLTRAKHNLYLISTLPTQDSSVTFALTMHDVVLDFFKNNTRKSLVLHLRSGDSLFYKNVYLLNEDGKPVVELSNAAKENIQTWQERGYDVTAVEASYLVAWSPENSDTEWAVCLANITLTKCPDADC